MMDPADDDDEMADLFSFGTDMEPPPLSTPNKNGTTTTTPTITTTIASSSSAADAAMSEIDELFNDVSDDSFLRMLDEHPLQQPSSPKKGSEAGDTTSTATGNSEMEALMMNDPETQDIMNWLEEDDTDADALLAAVADESAQKAQKQTAPPPPKPPTPPPPEPVVVVAPTVPIYESFQQVLESSDSTKLQIMEYWEQKEKCHLQDNKLRPLLWCRIICGKSIDELSASSLADSFQAFVEAGGGQGEGTATGGADNNNADGTSSAAGGDLESWIRTESAKLAPRIVRANPNGMTVTEAEEALQSILLYHYHSNSNANSSKDNNNVMMNGDAVSTSSTTDNNNNTSTTQATNASSSTSQEDPLLPPVVCAILSAGVPKLATPVLMSHIIPSFMPFVALTPQERWEASKLLHSQFYLLACYHLPMLVYHLDRYVPGWYWPLRRERGGTSSQEHQDDDEEKENHQHHQHQKHLRGRYPQHQGVIPPSWLMTHLVGECGGTFLDPQRLLQLLDLVFTNENNSLRFFLVLAILEQHSDNWLELTGQALMDSLTQNMHDDSALLSSSSLTMEEWAARAQAMKQATPDSVVDRLRTAEDEAVRVALKERQKRAEAALKARLEAEAAAHRDAQERKAEEARTRLTRARLVAYYRRFNPSKEANIDKIMETYKDKFEELDMKLKKKYGVGFNPAINPNKKKKTMTEAANESMKKTMQSMNEGIKRMASSPIRGSQRPDNPLDDHEDTDEIRKKEHRVSVSVKVGETLPYVCMTREQANDIRRVCLQKDLPMPLRFYLVDSRAEEVAEEQGRFPTAARLSPETLMDPELLQKYEDSFEAVRGSFHICVMGEGHSAIPALYNQKLTPALEEYMREDEARTNDCALFFVKRGFPFVSVLEGGFASAHAWLLREGSKKGFDVKALLVDYNPEVSLFGQMEKIKKEQVGYKAQRALHALLEASIPDSVKGRSALEEKLAAEANSAKDSAETKGTLQRKASNDDTSTARAGPLSFFGRRQSEMNDESSKPAETPAPAQGITAIGAGFFGRRQQPTVENSHNLNGEEKTDVTSTAPETSTPAPASTIGGFFRRQQVAPEKQAAPPKQTTDNNATEGEEKNEIAKGKEMPASAPAPVPLPAAVNATAPAAAPAPASAPAPAVQQQNRFSRWRQAAASAINANEELAASAQTQQKQQAAPPAGNRFGGAMGMLGRSVSQDPTSNDNNAANNRSQPMLRRNPFARFGGQQPPGSEAAKAAMTTATSAFGGFMKVATNAKPNFGRAASTDIDKPKEQQPQQQQQNGATVISLPPRPDEVGAEESISKDEVFKKKVEPTLRAV